MWNEDNGKSDIPRNLIVSRIWSWQEIYKARNTENKPKQIHTAVSRNLTVSAKPPLTLRAILDTLWWSWVKKSFPTSIEMYVGGLIYQEQLVATSFQWAEALQRFCSRSQGVVALVSVSDGKIQITILILRRGALSRIDSNLGCLCLRLGLRANRIYSKEIKNLSFQQSSKRVSSTRKLTQTCVWQF